MTKKISKDTFQKICELVNTLSFTTTGIQSQCFCTAHSERDYDDEVLESLTKTCKNIANLVIKDSNKHDNQEKQIYALQEAYKSLTTRLELIKGILSSDPNPSTENEAALTLLKRDDFGDSDETAMVLPHIVFIHYGKDRQITDIKWVKYATGVDFNEKVDP